MGYLAMGGQIIDATIVPAPRQRNSRDDNAALKAGGTPPEWAKNPAKNRQKDNDARWTKKHCRAHFAYKNHIGIDRRRKLMRLYSVSTASVHDSQKLLDDVLDPENTVSGMWANSAYRSAETETKLAARTITSHIHRRGSRHKPLTPRQEAANKARSKGPGTDRACLQQPAQQHGRQVRAHYRHRPGRREDRDAEPGLQHAPLGCPRKDRGGNKLT